MSLELPEGFNDAMRNLQSELNRARKPIEMPTPDFSKIQFTNEQVEYLKKVNEGVAQLQKKSWPERHWLLIAVVTFILTSIVAPLVVEKLKPTLLPTPTEGQLKFEETDSPNKDTTTVLPTATKKVSDATNQ